MPTPIPIQPTQDEMRILAEAAGFAKEQFNLAREILKHSYPAEPTNPQLMAALLGAIASNFAAITRRS